MNIFRLSSILVAFAFSFPALGGEPSTPKANTAPVDIMSNSKEMKVMLGKELVVDWLLAGPGVADYANLAPFIDETAGKHCIVTDVDKGCHKLKKGEVGLYHIRYKGEVYAAYLRM